MKAKFGAIVVDGRGKVGGHVASKNRSGAYFRTKVTPSNPQSAAQGLVRSIMAEVTAAWRGLTQAQRNGWNEAVANYARTNVFGDSVLMTGKNLFQSLNSNLLRVGESMITTAPLPVAVNEVTITAVSFEDPTVAADVTLTTTAQTAGAVYEIYATACVSPGVGAFKGKYRKIMQVTGAGGTSVIATAAYVAKFGNPIAGQKASFMVRGVMTATGQQGIGSTFDEIATVSS